MSLYFLLQNYICTYCIAPKTDFLITRVLSLYLYIFYTFSCLIHPDSKLLSYIKLQLKLENCLLSRSNHVSEA